MSVVVFGSLATAERDTDQGDASGGQQSIPEGLTEVTSKDRVSEVGPQDFTDPIIEPFECRGQTESVIRGGNQCLTMHRRGIVVTLISNHGIHEREVCGVSCRRVPHRHDDVAVDGHPSVAIAEHPHLGSRDEPGDLLLPLMGQNDSRNQNQNLTFLSELVGLWAPLVLIGVIQVGLAVWLVTARLPDPTPRPTVVDDGQVVDRRPRSSAFASLRLLRRSSVAGAALLSLTIFLPVGVYDALWARYLTDAGASTLFIGIGLSLYAVPIVVFAPTGGRIADRFGPVRATSLAICGIIPLTIAYGLVSVPLLITAIGLLESLPQAVATPAVQTAMLRACRPDEVAAGQGVAHAVNQIGAGTAALVGPMVYGAAGATVMFGALAGVMVVLFLTGLALHRRGGGEAIAQLA